MKRIWIFLIVAVAIGGGCGPSPQESTFFSGFPPEGMIKKNLPEGATIMRSSRRTDALAVHTLRLLDSTVECLISPAGENGFMEAIRTEVEGLIQSSGAEIETRVEEAQIESSAGGRRTVSKFEIGYITGKIRGFIWVRGVRCEGEHYKVIIVICEG